MRNKRLDLTTDTSKICDSCGSVGAVVVIGNNMPYEFGTARVCRKCTSEVVRLFRQMEREAKKPEAR